MELRCVKPRTALGPPLVALAATLATIAPDGNGPGVTCDELYLVNQGVVYHPCQLSYYNLLTGGLAGAAWILQRGQIVREYRNQGVWLARLIQLPPSTRPPEKL